MDINVLHAEREFVRDDKSLGSFRLDWIPPAPRGVPHIAVKFDIDANGILSVTAVDKGTGNKQDITITRASTLSSDEVERMVSEAERFAKEDVEKRDTINTKNQDDRVVYQTEKQLKVLNEKEPAHVKKKVEAELTEKEAVSGGSYTSNEGCHGRAESRSNAVGTVSVYNQPDAGRAPGGADSTGPVPGSEPSGTSGGKGAKDGDVIDVNFTDSK